MLFIGMEHGQNCQLYTHVCASEYTIYITILFSFIDMKLKEKKNPAFKLEFYLVNEQELKERKVWSLVLDYVPCSYLQLLDLLDSDHAYFSKLMCSIMRALAILIQSKYDFKIGQNLKLDACIYVRVGHRRCRVVVRDVLSHFCSTAVIMY